MKKHYLQLLLIQIISIFLAVNASEIENVKEDTIHGYSGEFTLSQTWPYSRCYLFKHFNSTKKCQPIYFDRWSILQFIPRLSSGHYYSECNYSIPFKSEEISSIKSDLESRWFSFDAKQNPSDIWKSQWENSGVCGVTNDQTNTQFKYFNKGLELSQKYNMARILSEANIIPGRNYTKQTIIDAVTFVLGEKKAIITCQRHHKTTEYYLLDILIWFNKNFEPTTRGHEVITASDCPDNQTIIYPDSIINQ